MAERVLELRIDGASNARVNYRSISGAERGDWNGTKEGGRRLYLSRRIEAVSHDIFIACRHHRRALAQSAAISNHDRFASASQDSLSTCSNPLHILARNVVYQYKRRSPNMDINATSPTTTSTSKTFIASENRKSGKINVVLISSGSVASVKIPLIVEALIKVSPK
jgi:hypothetical protein